MVISFKGKWSRDDFRELIKGLEPIRGSGKEVNLLIDLRPSHLPPMNIMGVISSTIADKPSNLGQVILITKSNIWKRLYHAITLHRKDLFLDIAFVGSVDTAYRLLTAETGIS